MRKDKEKMWMEGGMENRRKQRKKEGRKESIG
jgi:hypothetical protein